MRNKVLGIVCVCVFFGGTAKLWAADAEKTNSGPQVGDKLPKLPCVGVFNDLAGKEVEVVEATKGKPTLLVFVHQIKRPSLPLLRALTSYAHSRDKDGLQTYIVWLSADVKEADEFLKRAEKSLNVKVPIVIAKEGKDGPAAWGLNGDNLLTVLVAKENKVTANFATQFPALTDAPKMIESIIKLIGGEKPTEKELEALAFPNKQ